MTIRMKDKKTSKGVAGSGLTQKELKELKFKNLLKKIRSAKPASRMPDEFDMDDMAMPMLNLSEEQLKKIAKDSLLAKGGEVKKFKDGGSALKPVNPETQKGLSKLPKKVRNKMGYMKKGGKV